MNANSLQNLPKVTKIILFVNIGFFIISYLNPTLNNTLALYYHESSNFMPHQLLSHIFMHGDLMHLAFNMYALFMFGSVLEKQLGDQRFILLYFFSAAGAFLLQLGITWYQFSDVPIEILNEIHTNGAKILTEGKKYADTYLGGLNIKYNVPMVGASGAIMGLLISFAILFPNAELQMIFIPIPIKAKYFMPGYMLIELYLGVQNFEWDNIAHFAHLGGAIAGGLLMFYWKTKIRRYY